jgi:hypothetical protein
MVATKNTSGVTSDEKINVVNDDDSSASSTSGSADWSSDDGFSSVDASTVTSETQVTKSAAHAANGTSFEEVSGSFDTSEPRFVPSGRSSSSARNDIIDKEDIFTSPSKGGATGDDLDEAIQAGDWKAVGTTAALIANANAHERDDAESFGVSQVSFSTHEQNQVDEFEQLVEQGDWMAVMAAASRFENASDLGSLNELRRGSMDESLTSHEDTLSEAEEFDSPDKLRAEIEELVRVVVPDELGKRKQGCTNASLRDTKNLIITFDLSSCSCR